MVLIISASVVAAAAAWSAAGWEAAAAAIAAALKPGKAPAPPADAMREARLLRLILPGKLMVIMGSNYQTNKRAKAIGVFPIFPIVLQKFVVVVKGESDTLFVVSSDSIEVFII